MASVIFNEKFNKNNKNVVCRVFVVISLLLGLVSCKKEQDKVEDGVS